MLLIVLVMVPFSLIFCDTIATYGVITVLSHLNGAKFISTTDNAISKLISEALKLSRLLRS